MSQKSRVSTVSGCCKFVLFGCLILMIAAPLLYAQEDLYGKALHAYHKKDFKATVKYLKEYVAQKPDAGAYYLLGYASYKLKNRKEAAEYFREAYLIDPNFTPREIHKDRGK